MMINQKVIEAAKRIVEKYFRKDCSIIIDELNKFGWERYIDNVGVDEVACALEILRSSKAWDNWVNQKLTDQEYLETEIKPIENQIIPGDIQKVIKGNLRMRGLLKDVAKRMERARSLLTKDNPTWDCNWGMLDNKDILDELNNWTRD